MKPPVVEIVPINQLDENTTDFEHSPHREEYIIHPGSVAARIRERKYRTRGGSSKHHVKSKLVQRASTSRSTRTKAATSKDNSLVLIISDDDEGLSDCLELKNANAFYLKVFAITPPDGFSSKNYVRKFLRAVHPKWRAKFTMIEESKDLSSLALDELIDNLKVHEVVMKKDSEIYKGKKERVNDDEEYAMAVRNFKKFLYKKRVKFVSNQEEKKKPFRQRDEKKGKSDRNCFRCGDPNHLIDDCPKPPRNKDQKAFIGGSWSDSENDAEDKTNDENFLMAQSSNEVTLNSSYYSNNASSLNDDSMQMEYDNLCEKNHQ
ncbi:zf-CCHC domain-containing protein [Tanacetum coccineum]